MSSKMIRAATGHTLCVTHLTAEDFKAALPEVDTDKYTKFYVVQNWDRGGKIFFYLAKGYHTEYETRAKAAREVHAWYPLSKSMWSSYGADIKSAIDGAARDGWMHA